MQPRTRGVYSIRPDLDLLTRNPFEFEIVGELIGAVVRPPDIIAVCALQCLVAGISSNTPYFTTFHIHVPMVLPKYYPALQLRPPVF